MKVILPNGKPLFSIRDFKAKSGSHVLIQGESGRGKTTLLHLIAGLFEPQEGEVTVGEFRLRSMNDDACCDLRRTKIGLVFQKLNLIDHMTVEENVFLSTQKKNDFEVVKRAIKKVNLDGRESERCSVLSQGEQQRVAVARVLAQQPDVILADEPTSSLDGKNGDFVISALKEAAKGKTLIVVSHDQRINDKFDRVIRFEELIA